MSEERKRKYTHIAVAALFALAFLGLAIALKFIADVSEDDLAMVKTIAALRTPLGITLAAGFSLIGDTPFVSILSLLTMLWLYARNKRKVLLGFSVSIFGALISMVAFKEIIERSRPDEIFRAITESGFSFPSGHATMSAVFYGWIGFMLSRAAKTRGMRIFIACLTGVVIIGIGASRLYLGVHYPTDVAAGFSLGLFWLLLGRYIADAHDERPLTA